MQFKTSTPTTKKTTILIVANATQFSKASILKPSELSFATAEIKEERTLISINQYSRFVHIVVLPNNDNRIPQAEAIRRIGCLLKELLNKEKAASVFINNISNTN